MPNSHSYAPGTVLQALADSGISAGIQFFTYEYGEGWFAWLGARPPRHGWKADCHAGSLDDCEDFLISAARRHYPDSEFSKNAGSAIQKTKSNDDQRE